jgi:hypothetical protein
MAHHLAEQIERVEAAPAGEAREQASQACADLILRVWAHRQAAPMAAPLKAIAPKLQALLEPRPRFAGSSEEAPVAISTLLQRLEELHRQEVKLCLEAWVAGEDLTMEREYLRAHPGYLSDEERRSAQLLIELQDALSGLNVRPDDAVAPLSSDASEPARLEWVLKQLQGICDARQQYISASRLENSRGQA